MVLRKLVGIVMITLLVGAASLASAGVPDLLLSTSARADGTGLTAVVFNLPNGAGARFDEAVSETFVDIDASISLTLLDGNGVAVANFPREDVWLVNDDGNEDGGLTACPGEAVADLNTDAAGQTEWKLPLTAGGHSQALTVIMVSNAPLESSAGELISFNSADINGDFTVDLIDVVKFTQDFYSGGYVFRSDFLYDGEVDLLDVVVLAQAQGATCGGQ